jgi:hypothetical protein
MKIIGISLMKHVLINELSNFMKLSPTTTGPVLQIFSKFYGI